ncbi:MAG: phage major capsid protein [Chthoniobacter sp.]|uniref:phage major capsid protein n=1 Tax=Chthoniobacter sp. TaxID=2510640 RepID=UPI0032A21397
MTHSRPFLIAFAILLACPTASLRAQNAQPSAAEQKLRESLRNTMLQLRTSDNDKAVAQAALTEAEEKSKALTEQIEKITKQLATDKTAADKAAADQQAKIEERDKQIADLQGSLAKWQADHKRITDIANTKEAQRAKLETQTIELNRRVADQQTKNASMFKIANDILARYEKFGLGDALSAREPFTGITRVKLQSLFEDYQDKLVDQRIKPVDAGTPETKATPAPDKVGKPKATSGKAPDPKLKS